MLTEERPHKGLAIAGGCMLLGLAVVAIALFALPRNGSGVAQPLPNPTTANATAGVANAGTTTTKAKGNSKTSRKATARAASTRRSGGNTVQRARRAWEDAFVRNEIAHVPAGWVAGYYDLYGLAQKTFGVNWLLLASVHRQETAFSTAASTYRGLNFAKCCAGPMQFNVTNGPTTTWERYRHSYRLAERPENYPHRTKKHPSVYDDYDAMMAAANLLRDSGAQAALDGTAWQAAYDYYGHDEVGVEYADQVLARAIGWSQTGFSINQGVDPKLIEAVHATWGAPVLKQYADAKKARDRAAAKRKREQERESEADEQTPTTETTVSQSP